MKNIKQTKEKRIKVVKKDLDFEQYLFGKYPDLFPTDENLNLLPQQFRCWNDCPKGWETLVDHLFGAIDNYVKNTSRSVENPDKKFMCALNKLWHKCRRRIDSCNLNNTFCKKLYKFVNKISIFFSKQNLYVATKPQQVKIVQYKEKFGTLRVYINGGDSNIQGMIDLAEYITSNICMNTGKPGRPSKRGGWYATLSSKEAKKLGYTMTK